MSGTIAGAYRRRSNVAAINEITVIVLPNPIYVEEAQVRVSSCAIQHLFPRQPSNQLRSKQSKTHIIGEDTSTHGHRLGTRLLVGDNVQIDRVSMRRVTDSPERCEHILLVVSIVFLLLPLQQKVQRLLLVLVQRRRHTRRRLDEGQISRTSKTLEDAIDLVPDFLSRSHSTSTSISVRISVTPER